MPAAVTQGAYGQAGVTIADQARHSNPFLPDHPPTLRPAAGTKVFIHRETNGLRCYNSSFSTIKFGVRDTIANLIEVCP